ncbi:MAG: ribosomal protein S18-alanine N-acetyltransferase [Pseudomonadota bacterium]
MNWRIRSAGDPDLPAILRLEQQAFAADRFTARQLRYLLQRAHARFLVAAGEGQLLGYAVTLYRSGTRRARLYTLAVAEAARGRGVARALIAALEADARRRGCRDLALEVRADNCPARQLYERLGFRLERLLSDYYADGAGALRMIKPLTP